MANDQEEIHDRRARPEGDAPAAGIDQVGVGAIGRSQRADTDHAVLGLDEDIDLGADVVGDRDRHAEAEIDQHPLLDVLSSAPRDLQAIERLHGHAATVTTRST